MIAYKCVIYVKKCIYDKTVITLIRQSVYADSGYLRSKGLHIMENGIAAVGQRNQVFALVELQIEGHCFVSIFAVGVTAEDILPL